MSYRALPLECYCGEVPEQILEVGFTSDQHLVIHYWCSACERVVFLSRTIEQCRGACPAPELDELDAASQDARFLQSIGIDSTE